MVIDRTKILENFNNVQEIYRYGYDKDGFWTREDATKIPDP